MQNDFEKVNDVVLIWPKNLETWRGECKQIRKVYCHLIKMISKFKPVTLIKDKNDDCSKISALINVEILEIENDDCWARDILPFKVEDEYVGFIFNGYNGILDEFQKDAALAQNFCKLKNLQFSQMPLICEGGGNLQ